MSDFKPREIRMVPRTELQRQKNYLELVPRPSDEDYQLLKRDIERDGLNPALPLVVNDDEVVLDGYTRLQIADESELEWVYVKTHEFEDHYAEKMFIINTNLHRRHLTTAQRVELGLKLEEIEQEKARERQRQAGDQNLKQGRKAQESARVSDGSPVNPKSDEPGKHGQALDHAARQVGVGRDTLWKGKKIKEAAETDPEVAEAWDKAKQGKATVNQVYQQVQEKTGAKKRPRQIASLTPAEEQLRKKIMEPTYLERMTEILPVPPPRPDEELMEALYHVGRLKGIPPEAIDGAIEIHPDVMWWWRLWSQELFDPHLAWLMTTEIVEVWQKRQRAAQPEEMPIPDDAQTLGPWALDYVHQTGLEALLREFPANSAHLIYSDAMADLEQVGMLGDLAARVLTSGKYLCVYVDKRWLPEAMSRLSGAGLTYFWSCSVFRTKQEVPDLHIREKWRLLLIYRKGEASEAGWDWFDDGVEDHHISNRFIIRQLLKGLTYPGQLVVNPLVGTGITGQVARSLGRRFLCFGAEETDVRAANQRISQVRLAEESAT
ncbi:MAG: DNA modification methylase [Syntrophobacterales bacterium]|jgi:hypothetical protein|nr:DNA modification methylase [Syntrophobacterales bacterium]